MRVDVRDFRPEDILEIENSEALCQPNRDKCVESFMTGLPFTFLIEGEVKACFGVIELWKGTGEFWFVPQPDMESWKWSAHKIIKYYLDKAYTVMELARGQATADADSEKDQEWLMRLGFQAEGRLRAYILGKDHIMYSRLRGEG
jgi:hypothetical protein